MNPISLAIKELRHRWLSSGLVMLLIGGIAASLTYLSVNNQGFQKEVKRNARDIGSNVVILPAGVDQFEYHRRGGFSDVTMSQSIVEQLLEFRASLNHLIPMLERFADCEYGGQKVKARIVGISASIPVPGRPKAPMQKSIPKNAVQLGSELASKLGIERGTESSIKINGKLFQVSHINRSSGTWQDSIVLIDLQNAQELFGLAAQISRIEAIECTSEQCAATGLKSDEILTSELARITDQAVLLRREKIANARSALRTVSNENLGLIQNALWFALAISVIAIASLNVLARRNEIGVLKALGYAKLMVVTMVVIRSVVLTLLGAIPGLLAGALISFYQGEGTFALTGKKLAIDWWSVASIGFFLIVVSIMASAIPALLAASRNPAASIGSEV